VVDEDRARVVVLHPDSTYKRGNGSTAAAREARRFIENRGTAQRLYKNMLVFIAPDYNDAQALRASVREFLAWQSIHSERDELNLDAQQRGQVASSLSKANETVDLRVQSAYNWLLTPVQPEPLEPIELQANRISGDDNMYDRAARKLRNDGLLIYEWSPDLLRMELDRYIWNEERGWEVNLRQLWEYLAQYCYFPRLYDHEVLVKAVRSGATRLDAPFAYATGKSDTGYHTGVVFRTLGNVYFDDNSLLIHPGHVAQVPPPEPKVPEGGWTPQPVPRGGQTPEPGGKRGSQPPEPPKRVISRYHGRVTLDQVRINKDVAVIMDEVVQHLTSQLGCDVEVTLEIAARLPEGFDEATVRTVSENSRTLGFDHYAFEEE